VDHVRSQLPVSQRRACSIVGQPRATQRRKPKTRGEEAVLTKAIVRLAKKYGRYGYRRVRQLLVDEGWRVSVKHVYRIWRRKGLKCPKSNPNAAVCGSVTDHVSVSDPSGPTMSGAMTSCKTRPRTNTLSDADRP
jgi:hypothetical protein